MIFLTLCKESIHAAPHSVRLVITAPTAMAAADGVRHDVTHLVHDIPAVSESKDEESTPTPSIPIIDSLLLF